MKFLADLHVHSRYSRATSRNLDPEHLFQWARKKGLSVVGTGDFTHPAWFSELKDKLVEAEEGLFRLRSDLETAVERDLPLRCPGPTRFLLTGEISCIYKKNGKTRKVHHLILMPDMASVEQLQKRLDRIGNIKSDGRPILGLDSRDLLEIVLESSDRAFFIPAHVWTPWFSLFGSKSGFDDIEECFEDLTPHIHALETGLSSDPAMNRLLSALDRYVLISNSDAHSPGKLGREANRFETDLDYTQMVAAMTSGNGLLGTIEFFPEEGKYHFDGHRKCRVLYHPRETQAHGGICPVCGKPVTVGVLNRVYALSDREEPVLTKDVYSLIPLTEVIAELSNCGPATKKVMSRYEGLLRDLGPELWILMEAPLAEVEKAGGALLAEAMRRMRKGRVIREGGYDGEYGRIRLFSPTERDVLAGQLAFFSPLPEQTRTGPAPSEKTQKQKPAREMMPATPEPPGRTFDPILGPLNDTQRKAVLHRGGHLLVVAGPGTGKTMTLTHRMAHLIRSGWIMPEQVLGLTFTRKAAREMEERIRSLLGGKSATFPRIATFHGFCLEVLRESGEDIGMPAGFSLCGESDREAIVTEILSGSNLAKAGARAFLKALPLLKREQIREKEPTSSGAKWIPPFESYQSRLRELKMVDLDDLEVETLRLFERHAERSRKFSEMYPEIFVDEYQDTNLLQVGILKHLVLGGNGRICAIGDPDQAIYGFRGAHVESFFRFAADFPGAREIVLDRNYRSSRPILEGAAALLDKKEPLESDSEEQEAISIASCRTDKEEAEMIVAEVERLLGGTTYFSLDSGRVASHEDGGSLGFGDIGILFRLNAQGDALQEALSRAGIPIVRSGETPLVGRNPVRLLWRFLQSVQYPETPYYARAYEGMMNESGLKRPCLKDRLPPTGSVLRIVEEAAECHGLQSPEGEEAEALRRLMEWAGSFDGDLPGFLDALSLERGMDHAALIGDRVSLMSLHAAKGLEWPVVFIIGCEDRLMPCSLFGDHDPEEEKRLFYVGMTRARSRLILSHARRRVINGRVLVMSPSPFLEALPPGLCRPLRRTGWKPKGRPHQQLNLF